MFESLMKFFKRTDKKEEKTSSNSRNAAKERLHLVLMQDRANVSADFLELMKQEIIEVIKKYIDVDEGAIDVRLTNKENEDGTNGAPALYANIPIINIKNEARKIDKKEETKEKTSKNIETKKQESNKDNKEEQQENKNEEIKEIIEQPDEKQLDTKSEESEEEKDINTDTKEEVKSE